jgi:SAM-dependent methyltransferase
VFNDRSASRSIEERFYQDGAAALTRQAEAVADSQLRTLQRMLGPGEPADRSVLDIGCGRGEFLSAARAQGWRVAGTEIDPASAAACCERGLEVTVGSLFDTPLPVGPWSVITLWDVLDHLENPAAALQIAVKELAPGGLLLVRGRNGLFHVRMKLAYARMRPLFSRLGIRDLAVVHRWGITPHGWTELLRTAGLNFIRPQHAAPTPGDRYGSLGTSKLADVLKSGMSCTLGGVHRLSAGRIYPYPSVLISARR